MPLSYQNYTGDNSTTQFSIPFTYQNTTEISVTVNGVAETGLTFPSSSLVQLTSAPATGAAVQVRRTTNLSARAVDFVSGSVLTEEDLDNSAIQVFHAAQETKELADISPSLPLAGGTMTGDINLNNNDVLMGGGNIENAYTITLSNRLQRQGDVGTFLTFGPDQVYVLTGGSTRLQITNTSATFVNDLTVGGDLTATSFTGDGSGLTNLPASEILTKIKTVDGAGSGLDADTVDGVEEATFMRKSANSSLDMNGNTITDAYNVSIQNNLVHEGDTNTYLGFGTNTLNFYANGIQKMVINPTSVAVTGTLSATALTGDGSGLTNLPASYSNSDVDTHLNSSTALTSQVLSWNGSDYDWVAAGGGGDLLAANNLSDLANAATARTNLGLGTAATTASTDYATAAQGTTADAALPRTGGAMTGAITTNSTFDGRNVSVDGSKLDGIDAGANNYVHPNHTGEVTSTADGATVIADNVVDEANLKVSNAPTNGYALTAQSGAAGGLTWAAVSGGSYNDSDVDTHLNTSTAATNEVLSWNGTDYDWVAQSGGGGGADLYAANEVSVTAQPSATGDDAVAIGDSASAAAANSFAIGHNASTSSAASYSIALGRNAATTGSNGAAVGYNSTAGTQAVALGTSSVASGTSSLAGPNATASATNSYALGQSASASNFGGAAFGKGATTAVNNYNVAIGNSYTSGADAFAAAIASNSASYGATGANSIAMGQLSKSTLANGVAIGKQASSLATEGVSIGTQNTIYSPNGVGIGITNSVLGTKGVGLGTSTYVGASYGMAFGFQSRVYQQSQFAFAAGNFASFGDAQGSMYILRCATTDATPTVLTTDGGAGANFNQIEVQTDQCLTFDGTITAMQNGAQSYASWRVEGLLVNDGGTTTVANSAITVIDNQSSWGLTLTADNTKNCLAITFTGEAAHNIRTVANIRTSEVTYA